LPALEALALGAVVVCPDCIGNRAVCRDRETALVPPFDAGAIAEAAREAAALPAATRRAMDTAAAAVVARHGPDEERRAFLAILDSLPPTGGRP
ncbi:MAG: glycosyltransferase, partial [Planctomycetota bacterium]